MSCAGDVLVQLCINYCNEKLNNHFNEHVFKGEIAAYAAEGVVVPNLVFKDNQPILDFIEGKGDGIYSILDEQVRRLVSMGTSHAAALRAHADAPRGGSIAWESGPHCSVRCLHFARDGFPRALICSGEEPCVSFWYGLNLIGGMPYASPVPRSYKSWMTQAPS